MDRKIKEIYNCDYFVNHDRELYSLESWYNQLIDKTVSELNELDVVRMMRQGEFVELAIKRALDFLRENPFSGELAEGEFFCKMSKLDNVYLLPYKKELKEIFTRAVEESESYEWLYEQDKKDFEKVIPILFKKFQEME